MLLEVDELKWSEFISIYGKGSLFVEPVWLSITATNFEYGLKYYIWTEGTEEVIGFPIFYKDKTIKAPTNFHFFPLVVAKGTEEQKSKAFISSVENLKHRFGSIRLKMEIDFPYQKELECLGFNVAEKFTYIKSLNELNYSRNIFRMIKKAKQQSYTTSLSTSFESSFSKIWESNKGYLLGSNKRQFSSFFFALIEKNFSQILDLHEDDFHVASLLVIEDQNRKVVYTYLISIPDKKKYPGAQAMLYDYGMSLYKSKGFLFCDLCGANLPNVSKFKAKFNGDLERYQYAVYNSSYFSKIEDYIKKLIRR